MVLLKDIAVITSGVTFRSRLEPDSQGNVCVIQMKDLGNDNRVHLENTIKINGTFPKKQHLAQRGDLIFRSRGQTTTAALIDANCVDTIVAAPLFRIRINTDNILPEYLLWFINQLKAQRYLASRSKGTVVKMISKLGLEHLEIDLPSLDQQKMVSKIYTLSLHEQDLQGKIKQKRAIYVQGTLMQMVSRDKKRRA